MQQTFNHPQKVGFLSRRASKSMKQGRKGYAPLMLKVNQTIDLLIDESGEEPVQPNQTQAKFQKIGRLARR